MNKQGWIESHFKVSVELLPEEDESHVVPEY